MNPEAVAAGAARCAPFRAAVALVLVLAATAAGTQTRDPGRFEVISAEHGLSAGTYYVNGRIYLRLPADASQALHERVPLTIRVEVQFLNRLRFWIDNVAHERSRRSTLTYTPLTDRYIVYNIGTNVRQDFVTLAGALEFIGQLDHFEIVRAAELDEDRRYDIRVRAVLDKDELPGPLRLLAFWRNDWAIASEWQQWRLDED